MSGSKKEKELAAFHARQAFRNKNAVPVDPIIVRKSFKPCLEEDNSYDVLSYSHNNDRSY